MVNLIGLNKSLRRSPDTILSRGELNVSRAVHKYLDLQKTAALIAAKYLPVHQLQLPRSQIT